VISGWWRDQVRILKVAVCAMRRSAISEWLNFATLSRHGRWLGPISAAALCRGV
jgi:hypothetical protein